MDEEASFLLPLVVSISLLLIADIDAPRRENIFVLFDDVVRGDQSAGSGGGSLQRWLSDGGNMPTSAIPARHYRCSGRNPGKRPDIRRKVFASRTGSRDIAHDTYLCIAVSPFERPQG